MYICKKQCINKIKVPLARPTFTDKLISEYQKLVRDILISGRLTLGKYTRLFEEEIARFLGIKPNNVVVMNSCTAALHAIMLALRLGPSNEVIVPTYTFASTVNAPLYVGAKPILVDSDIESFNMSIDHVVERITPKTKAIIAVHIGGNPVELHSLLEIAGDHKLYLVEDAAHAFGSRYNNRFIGTFGISSAFSFYPNKIITTGEGGVAVTLNEELAQDLKIIRCVGRKGLGPTEVIVLGHNFRMSELQAALGVIQMKIIDKILENRRKIAEFYNRELSKIKGIYPQRITDNSIPSYYAYIIRIDEDYLGITRDKLREVLLCKYGVETTILYKPVHLHKYYKSIFKEEDTRGLENSEILGKTTLALPIYGHMTIEEARYVVKSIKEIINHGL